MDTNTQIERLVELAIIQRSELKRLVDELPLLKEHLSSEIERTFEEAEPQLRVELEEWTTKQTADKTAALGAALESKIASLAKSLEESAQAKFSAVLAARDQNAELLKQAEDRIAAAAGELPAKVKEIVTAELARFPRAGEIDRLRKEFQEPRGLNPRGKWLPDQTYNKLDLVTWNGDSYVSNTDGNKERPGRNAANWTLSAARGTSGGGPADLSALTAVPSNGALLIGSGTSWVNGQLTAGAGVSITVGPGAITISATDGDITLDDGTAASPSLHFTNDADTGIYRPAANTLGISVSGTQVAYFDQNGLTVPSAGVVAGGSIHAGNGNANNPSLSFDGDQDTGFFRHQPNEIGIALGGTQYATWTSTTFSITPVVTMASSLRVNGTTDSSSKDSGAIVTEGGLGVEKSASIGGNLTVSGTGTFGGNITMTPSDSRVIGGDATGRAIFSNVNTSAYVIAYGASHASFPGYVISVAAAGSAQTTLSNTGLAVTGTLSSTGNLTVNGTQSTFNNGLNYATDTILEMTTDSLNTRGPVFALQNNASGGRRFGWVSTGSNNGAGAGKLVLYEGDPLANVMLSVIGSNGNLLLGLTVDGGNGKLQLAAGAADKTSGIGFSSDTSLYRLAAGELALSSTGSSQWFEIFTGTTLRNQWGYASGNTYFDAVTDNLYVRTVAAKSIYLQTNATTALTLDSSQNATFAGSIAINNTVQTAVSVASTHKVTISIGGSTYYLLATNV